MDFLLISMRVGIVLALIGCLVCDIRTRRIPHTALAVVLVCWSVGTLVPSPEAWLLVIERVVTAFMVGILLMLCAVVYERLCHKESMGGGDVKLFMVASVLVGYPSVLMLMMISCVVALVYARLWYTGCAGFPFGPAIVMTTCVFLGAQWM